MSCAIITEKRLGAVKDWFGTVWANLVQFRERKLHSLTNTDSSIQAHCHPSHTLAAERSLRVDAVAVHTHARSLTFINVYDETQKI